MALQEYRKKRSFNRTPEPQGGEASGNALIFVVQKHAASRLHYDFRLELDGVLKSWAVPKGPSLNPKDKRLAMLVEDHPFDYKDFEGNIPEGNYGAGTVIIWDHGTYEPLDTYQSKAEREKALRKGFHAGQVKIRLHGEKLKGEFVLVKTPKRADNAWLLIKHRDEFASEDDVTDEDQSVVSGKTLDEVREDKNAEQWESNRKSAGTPKNQKTPREPVPKQSTKKAKSISATANDTDTNSQRRDLPFFKGLKGKKKAALPKSILPMLATLVDKPVDDEGWLFEVKWDGFRAISYMKGGEVEIRSRNDKPFNKKFYPIVEALSQWKVNAVVDGEIIVVNDRGFPDFNALLDWRSEADGNLVYYLFDLIWFDGYDLMNVPLEDRRRLLQKVAPTSGIIRVSESFDISGKEFFKVAEQMGLEGIVAKKAQSAYTPGLRSRSWLKIKSVRQQEAIIAGYTRNENSKKKFGALLMGVYEGRELKFIGPVGTGFNAKTQQEIISKLQPFETKDCPFRDVPDYNKPSRFRPDPPHAEVTWVRPQVIAEINYRTVAPDGTLRHPSFKVLREDKEPNEIRREIPETVNKVLNDRRGVTNKIVTTVETAGRKTLLNPYDATQVRDINGRQIKFGNLDKVFWPEQHISKRDMLNYYYRVAPFVVPMFKDRPQTLNRFPNGIHGKSFYQKDVTGKVPDWISTYAYYSEADEREKHFLVCNDEASLLYVASLGCIEMNPWSSRVQRPDHPDYCIIDLDPDGNPFEQVIETAQVTKQVLDALDIPSYCKTSGSTGLHIYIPLGAQYTYEDSKEFGRALARIIHGELKVFTSIERLTSKRKGKIYIDFLQNRPQATVAGPYSLRPKEGAPVSMPLYWDEVKKGLRILDFTIINAVDRLNEIGDIFSGVLGKGINMEKAYQKLETVFQRR